MENKPKKNEAHLRRIDRLKKIGFSNADIRWILNWAFDEKNKNLIKNRFMPNIVHIIAENAKDELDKVLGLEDGGVLKLSETELKSAEQTFLYDIVRAKRPDVKIITIRKVFKPNNKKKFKKYGDSTTGLVSMADYF